MTRTRRTKPLYSCSRLARVRVRVRDSAGGQEEDVELAGLRAENGAYQEREAELTDELREMEYNARVAAHNASVQAEMAAAVAAAAAAERRAAQVLPGCARAGPRRGGGGRAGW